MGETPQTARTAALGVFALILMALLLGWAKMEDVREKELRAEIRRLQGEVCKAKGNTPTECAAWIGPTP